MISQGFYYEQSFYLNDLIKVSVYHKTKAIKTFYHLKNIIELHLMYLTPRPKSTMQSINMVVVNIRQGARGAWQ